MSSDFIPEVVKNQMTSEQRAKLQEVINELPEKLCFGKLYNPRHKEGGGQYCIAGFLLHKAGVDDKTLMQVHMLAKKELSSHIDNKLTEEYGLDSFTVRQLILRNDSTPIKTRTKSMKKMLQEIIDGE